MRIARWKRRHDGFHVDVHATPGGAARCVVPKQHGVPVALVRGFGSAKDAAGWARKTVQGGPERLGKEKSDAN